MEESRCSFSSAGGQSCNRFETHITDISSFDLISKECKSACKVNSISGKSDIPVKAKHFKG